MHLQDFPALRIWQFHNIKEKKEYRKIERGRVGADMEEKAGGGTGKRTRNRLILG